MAKSRTLNILALIANLAIVGLEAFALISFFTSVSDLADGFNKFTNLSNILLGVVSLMTIACCIVSIVKGENKTPKAIAIIKLIGVAAISVTFVTVVAFLGPTQGFEWAFSGPLLYLHLICPVLAIISFIFFEVETKIKWRYTWLVLLPVVAYGIFYTISVITADLNAVSLDQIDFYGFAHVRGTNEVDVLRMCAFMGIMVGGTYILGLVEWLLNKLLRLIIIGYEYHDADIPEVAETDTEPAQKGAVDVATEKPIESTEKSAKPGQNDKNASPKMKVSAPVAVPSGKFNDKARIYHISRQKLVGKWQVKLATGEKAIKLFDTQAEAIQYAKQLVRSQGGSIRIHSMRGQLRKE